MIKGNWKKQLERAESGQSLVEMALSMVILVLLLSGLIDLGRLYFTYIALEDAVGEAALYLSIHPHCATNTGGPCAGTHNAQWRAENAVGYSLVNWKHPDVNRRPVVQPTRIQDSCGHYVYSVGETVEVEIRYNFYLLSPLVPANIPVNPIPIRLIATQTVIAEDPDEIPPPC
jgi:hypothetical protein